MWSVSAFRAWTSAAWLRSLNPSKIDIALSMAAGAMVVSRSSAMVTRFPSRLVRRPGVAPNAAAPEAPEFLMATPHTPKADLGLVRGARQFGSHRPRAAAGAFLEQGLGFDHSNRLLSEPCSLLARRCFG